MAEPVAADSERTLERGERVGMCVIGVENLFHVCHMRGKGRRRCSTAGSGEGGQDKREHGGQMKRGNWFIGEQLAGEAGQNTPYDVIRLGPVRMKNAVVRTQKRKIFRKILCGQIKTVVAERGMRRGKPVCGLIRKKHEIPRCKLAGFRLLHSVAGSR